MRLSSRLYGLTALLVSKWLVSVTAFAFSKSHQNVGSLARVGLQPPRHVTHRLWQDPRTNEPAATSSSSSEEAFVEELSEERRTNLFQYLLRDLQIEGVPLLGCDADQVHTLQAALWTTMSELVDQQEINNKIEAASAGDQQQQPQRVCMIFESIPMTALRMFVEDFMILKVQRRLMDHLPELDRITVSLVGKGVGPALLIEAAPLSSDSKTSSSKRGLDDGMVEFKSMAAMKAFVDRIVVGLEACPHISEFNGGSVSYRYSPASDVCTALSSFWNCICQLAAVREDKLSSMMLLLPALIAPDASDAGHARFAAVAELMSRSLCLYRGDSVYELLHFHPTYDRNLIFPVDQPAHGHLPPQSWLRPMLRLNDNAEAAEQLSEDAMALSNFQRRAPLTAVCIKRVSLLDQVTNAASGVVDLDLGNGVMVKASGVPSYCRNTLRLAGEGKDWLEAALQTEIGITE